MKYITMYIALILICSTTKLIPALTSTPPNQQLPITQDLQRLWQRTIQGLSLFGDTLTHEWQEFSSDAKILGRDAIQRCSLLLGIPHTNSPSPIILQMRKKPLASKKTPLTDEERLEACKKIALMRLRRNMNAKFFSKIRTKNDGFIFVENTDRLPSDRKR